MLQIHTFILYTYQTILIFIVYIIINTIIVCYGNIDNLLTTIIILLGEDHIIVIQTMHITNTLLLIRVIQI